MTEPDELVCERSDEEVKQRERAIKREKARLKKMLVLADKDQLRAAESLIDNLAYMAVELADLRAHLTKHGVTSRYQNGENQWGTKKSPEAEVYTSLMQRYLPAMKQLLDLLPEKPKEPAGNKPGAKLLGYISQPTNGCAS